MKNKHKLYIGIAVCILGLAIVSPVGAQVIQTFTVDWWTVDTGGGESAGGVYQVHDTLGQHDTGVTSGGQYAIAGGFWGAAASGDTPITPTPTPTPGGWGGYIFLPMAMVKCNGIAMEEEPNDAVSQANFICMGYAVAGAHDGAAGTGDLYVVAVPKAGNIQITLNTSVESGVQLLLYQLEGDTLVQAAQDAVPPFDITYTATVGRYYVYSYSDPASDNTGLYSLLVESTTQDASGVKPTLGPTPPVPPMEDGP